MPRTNLTAALVKLDRWTAEHGMGKAVGNGEGGLSRTELRALERAGYVERLRTESRKWHDATGSIRYVYRRVK